MSNPLAAVDPAVAMVRPTPDLYVAPIAATRPLQVAVLRPQHVPRWFQAFLEMAAQNSWLQVHQIQVPGARTPSVRAPMDVRAFLGVERLRSNGGNAALAAVPMIQGAAPCIAMALDAAGAVDWDRAVDQIDAIHPDVILAPASGIPIDRLAHCATHGCWQVDGCLLDPLYGGLAMLAPVLQRQQATPLQLQLHGREGTCIALAGSWGKTRGGSFTSQREMAFRKLAPLLLRSLHQLAWGQLPVPRHVAADLRLRPSSASLGRLPGPRALAATILESIRLRRRAARHGTWMLVVRRTTNPIDPLAPEMSGDDPIVLAPRGYWADPCVVQDQERTLVMVEELEPATRKGSIACLELHGDRVTRLGLVLDEPGHLSFPQVFRWQDDWYMTVESSADRRVSLYRATDFPLGWERVHDLATGRVCVDPVLHFHDGRWYLFANVAENGNSTWDELFLFVADELCGPYYPHPCNPIVSDVRRARPAGRLFVRDGRLIRPAQDCAPGYGAAVVFNEILELDPDRYRERPAGRLAPDWSLSLDGCHTYSAAEGIELFDAFGVPPGNARMLRLGGILQSLAVATAMQCAPWLTAGSPVG